jgi:hypothetical protein
MRGLIIAALIAAVGSAARAEDVVVAPAAPEPMKKVELIEQQPKMAPLVDETAPPPPAASGRTVPPGKQVRLLGGVIEQDLAIEWDEWHNKFARAVRSRVFKSFWESINIPQGSTASYHCEVTRDRKIKNLQITKSSGLLWYDRAILDAVSGLDGSEVLTFPANSQRTEVSTDLGISLGVGRDVLEFGDLEHQEITDTAPAENGPTAQSEKGKKR